MSLELPQLGNDVISFLCNGCCFLNNFNHIFVKVSESAIYISMKCFNLIETCTKEQYFKILGYCVFSKFQIKFDISFMPCIIFGLANMVCI